MQDILEDQQLASLSISQHWFKHDITNACRVDDGMICKANGSPVGGISPKPVEVGCHMNSCPCVCNPVRMRNKLRARWNTCISSKLCAVCSVGHCGRLSIL